MNNVSSPVRCIHSVHMSLASDIDPSHTQNYHADFSMSPISKYVFVRRKLRQNPNTTPQTPNPNVCH